MWKLNNAIKWVKEEITRKIRKYLKTNENESAMYQNLKGASKVVEKWSSSCHISKGSMSQSLQVAATRGGELLSPEGTHEGKNTCHLAAIRLPSHLQWYSLRKLRM